MFDNISKDGVYRLRLSNRNPYARYLVVKTYGTTQMKRAVCDVEDIRQQLLEWDDRFGITDQSKRGLKNLLRNNRPRARENYRNYYSVYDSEGNLFMEGFGQDIAEHFGCKAKTVCNIANTEGRYLNGTADGKAARYNVVKNAAANAIIITPGTCW